MALQGYVEAQYQLGVIYGCGHGILPADKTYDQEAMFWYKESAQHNHLDSFYQIGLLYKEGRGGIKDQRQSYSEAVKWFIKGSNQDHKKSDLELDYLFKNQLAEIPLNLDIDPKWLIKYADRAGPTVQEKLGIVYEEGHAGIPCGPKADSIALQWYLKACLGGVTSAFERSLNIFNKASFILKDFHGQFVYAVLRHPEVGWQYKKNVASLLLSKTVAVHCLQEIISSLYSRDNPREVSTFLAERVDNLLKEGDKGAGTACEIAKAIMHLRVTDNGVKELLMTLLDNKDLKFELQKNLALFLLDFVNVLTGYDEVMKQVYTVANFLDERDRLFGHIDPGIRDGVYRVRDSLIQRATNQHTIGLLLEGFSRYHGKPDQAQLMLSRVERHIGIINSPGDLDRLLNDDAHIMRVTTSEMKILKPDTIPNNLKISMFDDPRIELLNDTFGKPVSEEEYNATVEHFMERHKILGGASLGTAQSLQKILTSTGSNSERFKRRIVRIFPIFLALDEDVQKEQIRSWCEAGAACSTRAEDEFSSFENVYFANKFLDEDSLEMMIAKSLAGLRESLLMDMVTRSPYGNNVHTTMYFKKELFSDLSLMGDANAFHDEHGEWHGDLNKDSLKKYVQDHYTVDCVIQHIHKKLIPGTNGQSTIPYGKINGQIDRTTAMTRLKNRGSLAEIGDLMDLDGNYIPWFTMDAAKALLCSAGYLVER